MTLQCSAVDIGQGSNTAMAQMAAEALGIHFEDIHVQTHDTEIGTFDLGTFASRLTYAIGTAINDAARQINQKLKETAAVLLGCRADHLVIKDRKIYSMFEAKRKTIEWEKVVEMSSTPPVRWLLLGTSHRRGARVLPHQQQQGPGCQYRTLPFGFGCQIHEVDVIWKPESK